MKIVSLTAENIKRLTAVEITPAGALVQITGPNGVGKTSVLDSIWWALAGASHIQASPIHRDAKKGRIRLDLGELLVERRFTAQEDGGYTTSLKVTSADGTSSYGSPQKVLDALLGALAFDPLAFSRMKPPEQRDALLPFVDLDLDQIDRLNRTDYDARTGHNRDAKRLAAQADGITAPDERPEPIDGVVLVGELEAAGVHNAAIERKQVERERRAERREMSERKVINLRQDIDISRVTLKRAIAKLHQEVGSLEAENERGIADTESMIRAARAVVEDIAREEDGDAESLDPINTAPIRDQIAAAAVRNDAVRQWDAREKLRVQATALRDLSEALTDAMAEREAEKVAAIEAADLPVEGMGITADYVTLDGLPMEVASDAQQLQVSVALAAAMNPKLRVIRIRDGSLLDDANLASLATFAEEHDLQIWIERVDSSGKVGFVIEDGRLAGFPEDPPDALGEDQ